LPTRREKKIDFIPRIPAKGYDDNVIEVMAADEIQG
jgi:hypothetical protein